MKKLLQINSAIAACVALILSGCGDGHNDETYTIRGKVLKSCDDPSGVAGYNVGLFRAEKQGPFNPTGGSEWLDQTVTDKDGHFELEYEGFSQPNAQPYITLRSFTESGSKRLMMGFPLNENLELPTVYRNLGYSKVKVGISTPYPFSERDSLIVPSKFVQDTTGPQNMLIGPFQDGEIVGEISASGHPQLYAYDHEMITEYKPTGLQINRSLMIRVLYRFSVTPITSNKTLYAISEPCQQSTRYLRLDSAMLEL